MLMNEVHSKFSVICSFLFPMFILPLLLCWYSTGRTVISVPPVDQRVIKGTTATLICNATHDPRVTIRYPAVSLSPDILSCCCCLSGRVSIFGWIKSGMHHCCSFRWDRGGKPVLTTSGGRVSVRQGSLTIGQTWSGDIGDYTCTVTSAAGNNSHTARLEVMWVHENGPSGINYFLSIISVFWFFLSPTACAYPTDWWPPATPDPDYK